MRKHLVCLLRGHDFPAWNGLLILPDGLTGARRCRRCTRTQELHSVFRQVTPGR